MAVFNPEPPKTNDPSYLAYSKGTDNMRADNRYGALFDGIGDTLTLGLKATDDAIKIGLKKDVYATLDPIRDEFGVADAVHNVQNTTIDGNTNATGQLLNKEPPPSVAKLGAQLGRLTEAHTQGKLSDSYYWARMESAVREIRARYPGYRDEVDQMVSGVLGQTPANALRKSLQVDVEKMVAASQSGQDKNRTFFKQNIEYLTPEMATRLANPSPFSQQELAVYYHRIGTLQQNKAAVASQTASLALEDAKDKNVQKKVENISTNIFNSAVQQSLSDGVGAALHVGEGVGNMAGQNSAQKLNAFIQKSIAEGKSPNAQELAPLAGQFAVQESQMRKHLYNEANKPLYPGSDETLASRLGPQKLKERIELAMQPFTEIRTNLGTGDFTALGMNATIVKALDNQAERHILESDGVWGVVKVMKDRLGPDGFRYFMAENPNEIMAPLIKATKGVALMRQLNGTHGITDGIDYLQQRGITDPKAFNSYINDNIKLLTDPKTKLDGRLQIARSIYQDPKSYEFFQKFSADDKIKVFNMVASPAVTKAMNELKAADPNLFKSYGDFVYSGAVRFFQDTSNRVQAGIETSQYFDIKYSPTDTQLTLSPTKDLAKRVQLNRGPMSVLDPFAMIGAFEEMTNSGVKASVDEMNSVINIVKPVLEANGRDPKMEIPKLFNLMALDVTAAKRPSWFKQLNDAVDRALPAIKKNADPNTKPEDKESVFDAFFGRVPKKDLTQPVTRPDKTGDRLETVDPKLTE